jgi:tetratricopeptide (TPR) repeat protein
MKITAIWCAGLVLATVDASAAATDFDSFVQPDPFVQANAAFAHGEVSAAESLIAPLTQGRTPRADACALLGEIRMSQKRSNEGVELFQRAAILSPKNASYQSRLGNALLQSMGEVDESRRSLLAGQALTALRHSVELDPDDCDGYLGLANFYAAAPEAAGGGYDKAIQAAGELKKRQPLDGAITAAGIAESHGRLEAALTFYWEALQLFSGSPDLRACEPRVLTRLGRTVEARTCYEKVLEGFPGWEPAPGGAGSAVAGAVTASGPAADRPTRFFTTGTK